MPTTDDDELRRFERTVRARGVDELLELALARYVAAHAPRRTRSSWAGPTLFGVVLAALAGQVGYNAVHAAHQQEAMVRDFSALYTDDLRLRAEVNDLRAQVIALGGHPVAPAAATAPPPSATLPLIRPPSTSTTSTAPPATRRRSSSPTTTTTTRPAPTTTTTRPRTCSTLPVTAGCIPLSTP